MTMPGRINETDVKLLRMFQAVVACGGFTPAQTQLNVSAATVSGQMAELEQRLGFKLCERGRTGFRLTEEGRSVHAAAQRLFGAHEAFQSEVAALKGETVGTLRFGTVDNTATNPEGRIAAALGRFAEAAPAVHVALRIDEPISLERALLDGELDAAVAAFHHHAPGLAYEPLFEEDQGLYCGRGHPLFRRAQHRLPLEEIARYRFVARGYMGERQAPAGVGIAPAATGYHMEAIMLLILSGSYIGHLPCQYAAPWAAKGDVRELLPERFGYVSTFELAYRRSRMRDPVARGFVHCLREAHGASPRGSRLRGR
jgi:DNA-binding transcriptional LysR family regulator